MPRGRASGVFKVVSTRRDPRTGQVRRRRSRKYYCDVRQADGTVRRVPLATDKQVALQMRAELLRRVELRRAGIVSQQDERCAEARQRPVREHIEDWAKTLEAKGVTNKQAKLLRGRVLLLLDKAGVERISELGAARIQVALGELRREGMAIRTCNHYLRAVKSFTSWLAHDRRASSDPLVGMAMQNPAPDIRRRRRPLTDAELARLLTTTRSGPKRFNMTGEARALLYALAATSGLRASELRSLRWRNLRLDDSQPTVTVEAACSKHRREDVLPLRPDVADALRRWRQRSGGGSDALVFPTMPSSERTAAMLRADLADAGIEYETSEGVADFHALRHRFITALARGGVHPKVAQALARHSTVGLTLDHYSHTVLGDLAAALDALPSLPLDGADRQGQVAAATGTDGPTPNRHAGNHAVNHAETADVSCRQPSPLGKPAARERGTSQA